MAKIKKIKKAQSGMLKPVSRPVINDTSKTKGIGLEGFDPYKEKNSKEGRGGGGIYLEDKRPKLVDVWRAARSKKKGGVIKKAQDGVTKTRTFPLDTKKGYKAKVVEKETPEGRTATVKVRRTIGGFLSGKKKGGDYQIPAYNVPQREKESPERPRGSNTGNKDVPRRTKNGGKVTKKSISKPINKKSKKK
jgi:hypothetical protein